MPALTTCDDDNPCTEGDDCFEGECFGLVDENNCGCPTAEGEFCGDGVSECVGGVCLHFCETDAECAGDDFCLNGECVVFCTGLPDNAVCTSFPPVVCGFSSCQSGRCEAFEDDCTTLNDDCNLGTCDAASGQCLPQPRPNGTPCNDFDSCTTNDFCQTGTCIGTPIPNCP